MRQVCINRQAVLDYIRNANQFLDTYQIANALTTPERQIPERSVRAAVIWLILAGYLERKLKTEMRTSISVTGVAQPYKVWIYRATNKNTPISTVRHNPDDRKAQEYDQVNESGVYLQYLFSKMKS